MLEVISFIVKQLTGFLPGLIDRWDQHRQKTVAVHLLRLFCDLNDVLINARTIVSALRSESEPWYLRDILREQGESVRRARQTIHDLRNELILVSPEAYAHLVPHLDAKFDMLWYLSTRLTGSGSVPDPALVLFEGKIDDALTLEDDEDFGRYLRINQPPTTIEFNPEHGPSIVSTAQATKADFRTIKEYFEKSNPDERLAEIGAALTTLRNMILQHFDLRDLLPDVGDR